MLRSGIITLKEIYKLQVVRFVLVGVFSVLIEFTLFALLLNLFHISYLKANLIAVSIAIIINYFLTRQWVFEDCRYNARVTFTLFIAFTMAGLLLNQFLLWFMVNKLLIHVMLSKVFAIGLVAVFNFLTKKHVVFRA